MHQEWWRPLTGRDSFQRIHGQSRLDTEVAFIEPGRQEQDSSLRTDLGNLIQGEVQSRLCLSGVSDVEDGR